MDLDLKAAARWPATLPANLRAADLAVNLHGRGPQSSRLLLAGRPRRLLAFRCPALPETADGPAWDDDEHEVARWCRLVATVGAQPDPSRLDLAVPAGLAPREAQAATLSHPGAASAARRWPAERWAAVARVEHRAGRRVVITGSADERALAETVARGAGLPSGTVLAGRLDLAALAAAVASAARVVCGDTGVGHLATAVGTPSVLVFGPTPPSRWGPPAGRRRHRVLWSGSLGDPHAGVPDAGLLRITVADVLDALSTLDAESTASAPTAGAATAGAATADTARC
jgi:ADP-heptose:LPS heptosyltransferase